MTRRSRQHGTSLLEPLIAITILGFGLLGLANFQLNMLVQSADATSRLAATSLAEELLAQVRIDPANAGCYATIPPAGSCNQAAALATYQAWETKAVAALPHSATVDASVLSELNVPATNQMRVTLTWANKGSNEAHTHVAITDIRP